MLTRRDAARNAMGLGVSTPPTRLKLKASG